jgi:hypothetical protein
VASINLQGDTSGSISISAPSVAGSNTLTLPATTQTLATQNALGVRNLIINGDMRVDQRNAGTSVTLAAGGTYTLDRMRVYSSGSSVLSVQQSSDTPSGQGFSNSILITSLAATTPASTDIYFFEQRIEGYNIANLGFGTASAKTITISFWIKSSLTGQFGGALTNDALDRSYPFSYTISSANTWEKKTITIAGETSGTWLTNNGRGLRCRLLDLGAGSTYVGTANSWQNADYYGATGDVKLINTNGATVYVTGVQLEVGDTATPFEHRPYDMELRRCLRYYYKNIGNGAGTGPYGMGHCRSNYLRGQLWLPVTMRATPTMTNTGTDVDYIVTSGTSDFTSFVTRPSLDGGGPDGLNFRVQVASGMTNGNAALLYLNSSNSYLEFSAEL